MDRKPAGESEMQERYILSKALRLHEETAKAFAEAGLRRQAEEEWSRVSDLRRGLRRWDETWEDVSCKPVNVAAKTAAKRSDVDRWARLLNQHASMSRSVAADVAKNLLSSGRDLETLARQRRWIGNPDPEQDVIDGTALAMGCWKIQQLEGLSESDPNLTKLMTLAEAAGADQELIQEAKDFALEEELEQEWAKYASLIND